MVEFLGNMYGQDLNVDMNLVGYGTRYGNGCLGVEIPCVDNRCRRNIPSCRFNGCGCFLDIGPTCPMESCPRNICSFHLPPVQCPKNDCPANVV